MMRIIFQILAGPSAGRKFWLTPGQTLGVGRTELAEFTVPEDGQMSKIHFSVEWHQGAFRLRDCGSTNGTYVNGQRVEQVALNGGDEIVAGQTRFKVVIEETGSVRGTSASATPDKASAVSVSPPRSLHSQADSQSVAATSSPAAPAPVRRVRQLESRSTPAAPTPSPQVDTPIAEAGGDQEPVAAESGPLLDLANTTPLAADVLLWESASGKPRLTVVIKGTFQFSPQGSVTFADTQLPVEREDKHHGDDPLAPVRYESDMVPFKPRADIVLVGHAYAPRGQPVPQLDVSLRVGSLRRTLRVLGDRRWKFPSRVALVPRMTRPEPFVTMPLVYTRSFGGIDAHAAKYCPENLAGVGFIGGLSPESIHDKPLPNLEDPDQLIVSWESRPRPVGFGFYGRGWMPRLAYAGTFDERYRQTPSRATPEDFSYAFYNGAHPDLQVDGYLRGDEAVELIHFSPQPQRPFQLPSIYPLLDVRRSRSSPIARQRNEEGPLAPVLDTVVFVPDQQQFYLVFRAVLPLASLEEIDIEQIRIRTQRA